MAVGGWVDATFVENLKKHGIELIIDARTLFDKIYGDDKKPLIDKVLNAGDMLVMLAEHDRQMLIRCREGIDRTPFVHWEWAKMLAP